MGDFVASGTGVGSDVIDDEVGQRARVGTHPEIGTLLPRQLPDQEDQSAEVALKLPLVAAAVIQLLNSGVELVEQNPGADQARRQCVEEIAGRNRCAERAVGHVLERVVQNAQLGSELTVTSGSIGGLKARLPETPAGAEQRIVGHAVVRILRSRPDPGALQVASDLARMRLEDLLDRRAGARPLVKQHLAGYGLDVRIGELYGDPEAVAEPHQRRCAGRKRRLSGAHEHDPAVELGLHRLGHLCEGGRAIPAPR